VSETIEYRPALDGLRAVAVIAVVLFHAGATSGFERFVPGGFLGVSVFFTLSGYLVTTLLIRQSSKSDGLDVGAFWARRLRRLAPVSLVVIFATVLAASKLWPGMQAGDAAAGIFGFTNWNVVAQGEDELVRTIVGPLGPFWSLAVEEQFYALLTLAVLVSWRTARPIRTLSWIVGIGWVGSLLVQLATAGPQYRLEFGTDSRGCELLAGCALALLLHVRPDLTHLQARRLSVAGPGVAAGLVALAVTTDYDPPWLLRGGYAAVSPASAVLVASLLVDGPLTRVLAMKPPVVIGRLSYSWYVVHWPVILVLTPERTNLDHWSLLVVKVVISLGVAAVLHVCVEQPIRRLATSPTTTIVIWASASLMTVLVAIALL
jgi:peptidoglycan/LPS O-acetylase OafA/YrhL